MQLDPEKRRVLGVALVVAAVAVAALVAVYAVTRRRGAAAEDGRRPASVMPEIPEGEGRALSDSKLEAYGAHDRESGRRGGRRIDSYWDDIGDGGGPQGDDPADLLAGGGEAPSGRYREVTAEELFGIPDKPAEGTPAPAPRQEEPRYDRAEREAYYDRKRKEMVDEVIRMQEAAQRQQEEASGGDGDGGGGEPGPEPGPGAPERDRIDVGRVSVRRTGSVSSLDDGFVPVGGGSGVSSLDGGEVSAPDGDGYPFKCMFVRGEKLKSGSRVSVRLLEDMVVDGQLVPANTHLMATCSVGDRLDLSVASIEIGGRIIALGYDAYDAGDGVKGIYCPDTGQAADRLRSQVGNMAMNRARTKAGALAQDVLQAGQVFATGLGRDRSVTVPAGYQFYLVKSAR